jgi:hypothetical protein
MALKEPEPTPSAVAASMRRVLANPDNVARDYLRANLGHIASRNGVMAPWTERVDLRLTTAVSTRAGQAIELGLDVFNVANLIDRDWGAEYQLPVGRADTHQSVSLSSEDTMKLMPHLVLAIVVSIVGCASNARAPQPRAESRYEREMRAESLALARSTDTTWVRRMRDLERRTRLVPTDSLARLYAATPRTPASRRFALTEELRCEMAKLFTRAGTPAGYRAVHRMQDSLERQGIEARRFDEELAAAPDMTTMESFRRCLTDTVRLADSLQYYPVPGMPWRENSRQNPP